MRYCSVFWWGCYITSEIYGVFSYTSAGRVLCRKYHYSSLLCFLIFYYLDITIKNYKQFVTPDVQKRAYELAYAKLTEDLAEYKLTDETQLLQDPNLTFSIQYAGELLCGFDS